MEKPATDIYSFEDRTMSPKEATLLGVGFSSEKCTITDTTDEVLR